MSPTTICIISIVIIFLATTLGASFVFFIKKELSIKVSNAIIGFASGIMIAAGFFGLLLPAIENAKSIYSNIPYIPIVIGFLLGGLLLFLIDKMVPHIHLNNEEEGPKNNNLSKQIKFLLAVTIHNIPEGLTVGLACGIALSQNNTTLAFSALSLAIGISIQNIPEGLAVSLPLLKEGVSKSKSFLFGLLSGIVEPLFAIIGLLLATSLTSIMPWLLSLAAGAMIYVTIDDLLPASREGGHEHYGIWAFMIGFCVMMMLEMI